MVTLKDIKCECINLQNVLTVWWMVQLKMRICLSFSIRYWCGGVCLPRTFRTDMIEAEQYLKIGVSFWTKPVYLPNEQWMNNRKVMPKLDIWYTMSAKTSINKQKHAFIIWRRQNGRNIGTTKRCCKNNERTNKKKNNLKKRRSKRKRKRKSQIKWNENSFYKQFSFRCSLHHHQEESISWNIKHYSIVFSLLFLLHWIVRHIYLLLPNMNISQFEEIETTITNSINGGINNSSGKHVIK